MIIVNWKSIKNILRYLICILGAFPGNIFCQDSVWVRNPLLAHLFHSKTRNIQICQNASNLFFDLDNPHIKDRVPFILKSEKGVFLFPTGTGRVYMSAYEKSGSLLFKRLDSTHFYGYNGRCIYFDHKGQLFSYGGEGFWNHTGQLREFNSNYREWNITQINKEFRVMNDLFFEDDDKSKLYFIELPWTKPSTGERFPEYRLIRFDQEEKKNEDLGLIHPRMISLLEKYAQYSLVSIPAFHGCLINFDEDNQYFIDFEKKIVRKINSKQLKNVFFGNSENRNPINCFAEDSTIYFNLKGDSSFILHQAVFSQTDLSEESFSLIQSGMGIKGWISIFLVVVATSLIFYYFIRNKRKVDLPGGFFSLSDQDQNNLHFTPVEWNLLQAIREESIKGRGLTVEKISIEIGLGKKSLDVQKKFRTDILNNINHIFRIKTEHDEDLIERKRNEEDRRFFVYTISEEKWKLLISKMT